MRCGTAPGVCHSTVGGASCTGCFSLGAFLNELTETGFCMKLLYRRWRQAARGAFLNELTEIDHLYGTNSMAAAFS
eukprot:COSAG02_NODE_4928_length_4823_cov_19.146486_9_plen_76_part_00